MFIKTLGTDPGFYFLWITVIMFSICCHEAAHAYAAYHEGDRTAVDEGYLTLNPLRVMGWQSIIFLILCGIAWGSVPVRRDMMRRRHSPLLVSLAGPGMNLALIAVSAVGYAIVSRVLPPEASTIFGLGISANCFLLLFNMLPIPVFDGWELYRALFPALRRVSYEQAQQWGLALLLIILVTGLHSYIWIAASRVEMLLTI
ncbi:MAG: site-2 protease family protein [Lentisphaeria bacterium]